MKKLYFLICLMALQYTGAQSVQDTQPYSYSLETKYSERPIAFRDIPFSLLKAQDAVNDLDKSIPWRFGYNIPVDIDPNNAGQTVDLPNGDRLWRVRIQTPGSYSMNIQFDWFNLVKGATVRVAAYDESTMTKVYTHDQNNPEEMLGIWPLETDDVWVEFYEPAAVKGISKFGIGAVAYGYRPFTSFQPGKALNTSGACNEDVDCDITPPGADPFNLNNVKEDVKKSAGMLVVGNNGFCSGNLVNNTANNGDPYFLTANHCVNGSVAGWAFRFNWRSPNPVCASFTPSANSAFDQTASGATLLMRNSESDSALVRITDAAFFNNNPDVVWAGWDRSTTTVPPLTFGIHHPDGDIQKTCRDDQSPVRFTSSFNGNPSAQFWRINDWDLGVTEPGSSGSPLFNEKGQVIGMLSFGGAACNGTNDNGQLDAYGRFGNAWDFGNSAATRLRDWLDPNNTGQTTVDSFPQDNANDVGIAIESINTCSGTVDVVLALNNQGNNTINSVTINYGVGTATNTSNFNGTIAVGASTTVTLNSLTAPAGSQNYIVNATTTNGVTDGNPNDNSLTESFELTRDFDASSGSLNLMITTDDFGDETAWNLIDNAGNTVQSVPFDTYGDNTTVNITIPIVQSECYEFTMIDRYGDGICCNFSNGSYSLTADNGVVIASGGNFTFTETTAFGTDSTAGIGDVLESSFRVYPNPSNGLFNTQADIDSTYTIYDVSGKLIKTGSISNGLDTIDITTQSAGLYFMTLSNNSTTQTIKLLKN